MDKQVVVRLSFFVWVRRMLWIVSSWHSKYIVYLFILRISNHYEQFVLSIWQRLFPNSQMGSDLFTNTLNKDLDTTIQISCSS